MIHVAIISNEPTPYRIHVLERLSDEIPDVTFHNIFTHHISKLSVPWQVQLKTQLRPVFFEKHQLSGAGPLSTKAFGLYQDIRAYLEQNDIRLAILVGYNDLARMSLLRWARRRGLPMLLSGDSNIFAEGRMRWPLRPIKRAYVRWVIRQVSGLMPMGTCGRAFFRAYADHDKPEFLFPYEPDYQRLGNVNVDAVKSFAEKYELRPGRKRLLYCGRLVPIKRVDVLLDAFAQVAAQRPDWDLIIAGDGPLKETLEKRVPAALRERVRWLGFLQFEETSLCYQLCDVLVLPSEYEPWGLVINEAVACGLAVIATSIVGAATDLVRDGVNGYIVPPRQVEALAAAILKISAGNEILHEMRSQAATMLSLWRKAADPVEGVRRALQHFGLICSDNGGLAASSERAAEFLGS